MAEIRIQLTCPECSHSWEVLFDIVDFLLQRATTMTGGRHAADSPSTGCRVRLERAGHPGAEPGTAAALLGDVRVMSLFMQNLIMRHQEGGSGTLTLVQPG